MNQGNNCLPVCLPIFGPYEQPATTCSQETDSRPSFPYAFLQETAIRDSTCFRHASIQETAIRDGISSCYASHQQTAIRDGISSRYASHQQTALRDGISSRYASLQEAAIRDAASSRYASLQETAIRDGISSRYVSLQETAIGDSTSFVMIPNNNNLWYVNWSIYFVQFLDTTTRTTIARTFKMADFVGQKKSYVFGKKCFIAQYATKDLNGNS